MQTIPSFYLGVDVSKSWLDVSMMQLIAYAKQPMQTKRFKNTKAGLRGFSQWLKKAKVPFSDQTIVVAENTGIYHRLLWQFCSSQDLPIHIGNAAHIKWSFGIARGKNDVIDSKRLCSYAFKEADSLDLMPALQPDITELKDLMSCRKKLVKQLSGIQQHLGELKVSNTKAVQASIAKAHKAAINGLKTSIAEIEKQIKALIKRDHSITHTYSLLRTVPGVGHWTAVYLIGCTYNFHTHFTGKQLACYSGAAPFEQTSGSSIKGRPRVHKMANKDLKAMLYMGALSCIRNYPEFKQYYQRKLKEGKHTLSVLNAIRNKILLRVAAVINNQKPYEVRPLNEPKIYKKNA